MTRIKDFWRHLSCGAKVLNSLAGVAFCAVAIWLMVLVGNQIKPQEVEPRFGWAGPEVAREEWRKIGASFPKFDLPENPENRNKRVVLWEFTKRINGGRHLPTVRQLIGDCVGAGAKQAVDYLQCVSIAQGGLIADFRPVYLPYHYATGRNAPECGNGRIRGPDGSLGSWQAKALELYGVIPADFDGLPDYSSSVVRSWATRMPSGEYVTEGKLHLVRSAARVTSADQVRDAICNGYPVTIASDWGGMMRPPTKDGRLVNRKSDTWMHQMCIVAYDGETGSEPYWYILNSWGENAHGSPPDDAPPGGFWVTEKDVAYIVRQGDSFALSDLQGFPPRDLDLTPIGEWDNEDINEEAYLADMRRRAGWARELVDAGRTIASAGEAGSIRDQWRQHAVTQSAAGRRYGAVINRDLRIAETAARADTRSIGHRGQRRSEQRTVRSTGIAH